MLAISAFTCCVPYRNSDRIASVSGHNGHCFLAMADASGTGISALHQRAHDRNHGMQASGLNWVNWVNWNRARFVAMIFLYATGIFMV